MKNILLLLFLFCGSIALSHAQEEIKWMTMNEALAAQKEKPKKILMDAYTVWCGPCRMMDKNTFGNQDVAEFVNAHYYPVKFNAEGNDTIYYNDQAYTNPKYDPARKNGRNYQHLFAKSLHINGYPSIVFFDEQARLIAPIMGYRQPTQIEIFLRMIANDDYKELEDEQAWSKYQKNFKPSFRDGPF